MAEKRIEMKGKMKKPITEEQARILLEQVKLESEQNMRSSAKKWRRFLMIVIIIAVLVVAAVGIVGPMLIKGVRE